MTGGVSFLLFASLYFLGSACVCVCNKHIRKPCQGRGAVRGKLLPGLQALLRPGTNSATGREASGLWKGPADQSRPGNDLSRVGGGRWGGLHFLPLHL